MNTTTKPVPGRYRITGLTLDPQAQGGGQPEIGDSVIIDDHPQAVRWHWQTRQHVCWIQGRNASGEYGAKVSQSELEPLDR